MNAPPEKITSGTHAAAATWANLSPLLVEIRARRNEFSRAQKIPKDIVDRFRRVGVYRAMAAKRFGGEERTPADFCRLVERISEADGSGMELATSLLFRTTPFAKCTPMDLTWCWRVRFSRSNPLSDAPTDLS
ncbi:hypothetical protein [Bradyrhizobium sp. CCBAU 45321]|uniref:hypothetical protein n=1 Tax=Bradyrhizobium sp. CCBAU 45321 TaxID=1641878 RepID=UPI0023041840|nr:hypothetical protein [Bradyrhizobium sp. CCBAU 45321]